MDRLRGAKGAAARHQGTQELANSSGSAPDTATILREFLKSLSERLPIRMRLTMWYSASFLVVLCLFGGGSYYATKVSILHDLDHNLKLRIAGIEAFLKQEQGVSLARLRHELEEDSQLRPAGELLQISDRPENWVFASDSIRRLGIDIPSELPGTETKTSTLHRRKIPIRIATATYVLGNRHFVIQLGQSLEASSELLEIFKWILLAAVPAILLVASVTGYWMASRALRPMSRITEDAQAISALDISKRVAVPAAKDELHKLSTTVNQMMDRLELSFRQITQFTADASHELRTPISLIRTSAELALADGSPGAASEALVSILEEAERTTKLLEDLLLLARSDSRPRIRFEAADLSVVFRQAAAQTELLAMTKDISLTCRGCEKPCPIIGNPDLIRRLILTLTDNAVKYTPSGGSVYLSLSADETTAKIEIRDTGIGIAAEDLPHIFERFYRADKARHRIGGAGLGLSIAEWIARAHHAHIDVSSTTDSGSTFSVHFQLHDKEFNPANLALRSAATSEAG